MSTSEDLKWGLTNYISNKNYNFNREKILNICDESNVDDNGGAMLCGCEC